MHLVPPADAGDGGVDQLGTGGVQLHEHRAAVHLDHRHALQVVGDLDRVTLALEFDGLQRGAVVPPPDRQAGLDRAVRGALCRHRDGGDHGVLTVRRFVGERNGQSADPIQEVGGGVPGQVLRAAQDADQQVTVGRDPVQPRAGQRVGQPAGGGGAGGGVRDDLGDHRVVVRRDLGARRDAGVHPDATVHIFCAADLEQVERAGHRQVPRGRILGAEPDLDGVPGDRGVHRLGGQGLAAGDRDLQVDQVQSGDGFGHRVLDLQPGVHLQEREGPVVAGDELHGAGAAVVHGAGGLDRGLPQPGTPLVVDDGGGGLLHDLLVPALDRALALEQGGHLAVVIGDDLDLDVPGGSDVALDEHGAVAERGLGLALCALHGGEQLVGGVDDAHAAPAAAGRGLDDRRQADVGQRGLQVLRAVIGNRDALQGRHAVGGHDLFRGHLVAHAADRAGRGTDEDQSGGDAGLGEVGVLGEEAVPGVDRVGPDLRRGLQDQIGDEIRVGGRGALQADGLIGLLDEQRVGIGVGVHDSGPDAQLARRAQHPAGDLATVGDENLLHRGGRSYMRKTPKPRRPSMTLLWTADSVMPRTVRVSAGSMIPSS